MAELGLLQLISFLKKIELKIPMSLARKRLVCEAIWASELYKLLRISDEMVSDLTKTKYD